MIFRKTLLLNLAAACILLAVSCSRETGTALVLTLSESKVNTGVSAVSPSSVEEMDSHLYILREENGASESENITTEFKTARSPFISYDGRTMIFCGRKDASDPWQLWETGLRKPGKKVKLNIEGNCTDPVYLPGERIAFIKHFGNDTLRAESAIITCRIDGTDQRRVTFNPGRYRFLTVLNDGRLLVATANMFPSEGKEVLFSMRPDGTKAELFYEPGKGKIFMSRASESPEGKIVFTEADTSASSISLVSIIYNRPLHSRKEEMQGNGGSCLSAAFRHSGGLFAARTVSTGDGSELVSYNSLSDNEPGLILKDDNSLITAITIATAYQRPKKLPSEVDPGVKTGLLFCQNVNLTGLCSPDFVGIPDNASKIEIHGLEKSMGVVDVESDGSFYLKISSDTPFRITTYDMDGKRINGPGTWLYLRPNERRGCVGCHEDGEIVPSNRFALSVRKDPVMVPVKSTILKEKEIELE